MKASHIFIIFIIVVLLGVAAFTSLFILDGATLADMARGGFPEDLALPSRLTKVIHEDREVASIDRIEANNLRMVFVIEEGNEGLTINANRDLDYEKYFDYSLEGKTLKINDKNLDRPVGTEFGIVISVENPEDLEIDVQEMDGIITIDDTIKSLQVEDLDGMLTSETEDSYDIEIGNADGMITLSFDNFNAKLNIEEAAGIVTIEGVEYDMFEGGQAISNTYGSGENSININTADGIISIGDK